MYHIVHVTVIDRFENLLNTMRCIRLRVIFTRDDVFKQFTAGDEIKYQIVIAFLLDAVMKAYWGEEDKKQYID